LNALQRLRFLSATVILLQAADLLTTALGLAAGAKEHNPLVALAGWPSLVLLKLACVLGLGALPFLIVAMPLPKQETITKQGTWLLGGLAAFYVVVVVSNLAVAA